MKREEISTGETMLSQVTNEVMQQLVRELGSGDGTKFIAYTLARLENENPGFAHLANFLTQKGKSELGDSGAKLALQSAIIAYRALELGKKLDTTKLLGGPDERDPVALYEQVRLAQIEFAVFWENMLEKNPKKPSNDAKEC